MFVSGSCNAEPCIDKVVMVMDAIKLVVFGIELWKSMSRAVHDVEQLGQGKHKVKNLRDEEKKHSL